jgi:2-oxoisovalerate dehydrogenase E1 component
MGKGNVIQSATQTNIDNGESVCIITYGMGVHWAYNAAKNFEGQVEIIDIRTLYPLDEALIFSTVKRHGKCIVLTEEQLRNSFAEALAYRISRECFFALDAPVKTIGALDLPCVPMNVILEKEMLPNADKVGAGIEELLRF